MVTMEDLKTVGRLYDAAKKKHREDHSEESMKALNTASKEYDRVALALKRQGEIESSY